MKQIEEPKKIISESKGLAAQVSEMREMLTQLTENKEEAKFKKKSFKMPFNVKSATRNLKKMMEKNKVLVIMLKLTGGIQPTIGEIDNGRLIVGDRYWNAADDIVWLWSGKIPCVIICDWDLQPLTKRRLVSDTEDLKTWIHPQKTIIRQIEAREALDKDKSKQFNLKSLIVIGIVAIVAYYIFTGGN